MVHMLIFPFFFFSDGKKRSICRKSPVVSNEPCIVLIAHSSKQGIKTKEIPPDRKISLNDKGQTQKNVNADQLHAGYKSERKETLSHRKVAKTENKAQTREEDDEDMSKLLAGYLT